MTDSVAALWLPAASYAVTVIALAPVAKLMLFAVHDVVPLAVPEPPVCGLLQVTLTTPTLSLAVPPKLIVLLLVK